MEDEKKDEIREKILEIATLVYILKMALLNGERENHDTLPYGRFAAVIQNKINSFYETFENTL